MTSMEATALVHDTSVGTLFRRAARAEWTRMWTVRSTWWALFAGAGLMLFIGAAAGSGHEGGGPAPIWQPSQVALVPAQFAFMLVVLLAVTGEYGTGSIHSTLQWVPRREVVVATRLLIPVLFATTAAVIAALATDLVAWAFVGEAAEVVPADVAVSLGRVALVVLFGGVLTAGIGMLLRSTAGTLTAIFLLILALPIALGNTGVTWLVAVSDHLPGRAIVSMLVVDEVELTAGTIATVITAWTVAAVAAGTSSFISRDTA